MAKILLLISSILILLMLPGCGASSSSGDSAVNSPTPGTTPGTNTPVSQSIIPLTITLKDGIVRNATVQLASLLQGKLNVSAETDFGGQATLHIPSDIINNLANNDLLYIYGQSNANSTIDVNGFTQGLQSGQVKLRSFLPDPGYLKAVLASSNKIEDDPLVKKSSVVSHFTNAEAVLFDNELKKKGLLNSASNPNTNITTTESLVSVLNELRSEIQKVGTPTIKKFKLIAAATKAIIEKNISTILQGQTASITEPDQILFELAENETALLEPNFESNILPSLQTEVNQDLQSSEFDSPLFTSSFTEDLSQVSSQDMITAVDEKIELSTPQATINDLLSNSYQG